MKPYPLQPIIAEQGPQYFDAKTPRRLVQGRVVNARDEIKLCPRDPHASLSQLLLENTQRGNLTIMGCNSARPIRQTFQYACQNFHEVEFRRRDAVTVGPSARPPSPQSPFGECDPKPHTLTIPLDAVAASS